jgi:hypothetical protein
MRASAALPAAGAFDAAPLVVASIPANAVQLYLEYTRGGAAGAFAFYIEVSPLSADGVGADWYRMSMYDPGVLAAGADVVSNIQRERVVYTATGAAIETFTYGPIMLQGNVERIRFVAAESGNVGAPGTLAVYADFFVR